MAEEISSNSIKEPKIYRIGLYSKLMILINGFLIVISLMIGWSLWSTIATEALKYYINYFNNTQETNSNLQLSPDGISIVAFIISGLTLVLVVVPFIFVKTKNSASAFFSLIIFIFSAIIVIFAIIFFISRFETFSFLINEDDNQLNTIANLITIFLPWMLTTIFACLLLIHSLYLVINITSKYKSNTLTMPIAQPQTKNQTVIIKQETDDTIILPNTPPIATVQESTAAIQENNNTNQLAANQEKIISNPQTTTVHYTNHELSSVPTQGAYHAEAVPPTANTLTNLQPAPISNEDETMLSDPLMSSPTTETIINEPSMPSPTTETIINEPSMPSQQPAPESAITSYENNFQPKNQGGFDIKDQNEPEIVPTTNFNEQPAPNPKQESQPLMVETETIVPAPTTQKAVNPHWTLEQIEAVWEKAEIIDGVSDKLYRKDYGGAWMFHDSFTTDYATADNLETYSWTIVLHRPASQQGTTELYNLDPMNIVNAKSKGDNYPTWKTKISSKGNKNIAKEQNWKART